LDILAEIKRTIEIELKEGNALLSRVGPEMVKAVEMISECRGKVIITGIGKSGLIGQKISATMSSTGTPSVFMHPVEAAHGDMGLIMKGDVAIAISQSGETDELTGILPSHERFNIPVIAITGKRDSTLAKYAACVLDCSVTEEACPMNLAPTASTTVQLMIGDALAVALIKLKSFGKEDFALRHPGGALGKKLMLKVKDIMHGEADVPKVTPETPLKEALLEMTKKRFGCTAIMKNNELAGIFTDGDLRRLIESKDNPFSLKMSELMTKMPKTINEDELVMRALAEMEDKKISVLLVTGDNKKITGIIHLYDILRSGVV